MKLNWLPPLSTVHPVSYASDRVAIEIGGPLLETSVKASTVLTPRCEPNTLNVNAAYAGVSYDDGNLRRMRNEMVENAPFVAPLACNQSSPHRLAFSNDGRLFD